MKTIPARCVWAPIILALGFAAAIAACQESDAENAVDAGPAQVGVVQVELGTLVRWLGYIGDIEGEAEIRVYSPIPDRIVKLSVKEGDRVNAGQVLASIRSGVLREGVQQAVGGVDAARAQRRALEDQLERMRRLESSGAVTSSQLLSIESQFAAAEAQVRQLEALLGQARKRRGDAVIRAPIDGVVGQVFMKAGDMAVPQIPICTVVDMDLVRVKVRVPETDLPLLAPGQQVQLEVAVADDEPIQGTVSRVSPVLDRLSRTATMEVDLPNPDHELKPGMLARIRVAVERRENVVLAPKGALTVTAKLGDGQNLYRAVVAQNHKAVERFVQLGLEEGDRVEIVRGLEAGEQLIVRGQHLLADGDSVQLSTDHSRPETAASETAESSSSEAVTISAPAPPSEG